jgi:hypothetical protein
MAPVQKQVRNRKDEALADATLVLNSLDTARYQPIFPAGAGGVDSIGLQDFFSGKSQDFKLFNVRPDEVEPLLGKTVNGLTAALVKFDPLAWKGSRFAARNIRYNKDNGELDFTLKIVDMPVIRADSIIKKQ